MDKTINRSQKYINLETISAKLLFGATLLAFILSNSFLNHYYYNFFHFKIESFFQINLLFFINDGLMTIFFIVVGLEVKYEILKGSLNSFRKAALPGIGAIGGMVVPAGIYILLNYHDAFLLQGWAVPTATDIAFSLAVLSFFGPKVPFGLKAYLTTLAIFDDIAAIMIIAFFYTNSIETIFLGISLICIFLLFVLHKIKVERISIYLLLGIILWICFLKSGIHPTLAGVVIASLIPLENKNKTSSPLQNLQHFLHPFVALVILPLFALANAGISFINLTKSNLHITVILGTFLGLFLGKQIGIFGASWLAVKCHVAALPDRIRWHELYAIAAICGIGFTISLFIGALAFGDNTDGYLISVKIGVISGSLLSGILGYLLFIMIFRKKKKFGRFTQRDAKK
jgi:NhaA family Na+:H+ antiporter